MKVGLLESRAARLNAYWGALLRELEVELAPGEVSDTEALALGRETLPGEPLGVQLMVGRVLALGRVDAVLVPRLPFVTGDAWSEAFAELLPRRLSGLPPLIEVPDWGGDDLESAAAEIGLRLSQNAGRVRRALERVRRLAADPRGEMPPLARASRRTVAVIGPRALLAEDILAGGLRPALEAHGLYGVFSHELPLADVLRRAERLENAAKVPAGERELFGAASLLAGKSAVRGLIFTVPARDGAVGAALERLERRMHKPTLLLSIEAGQSEFPELEVFQERLNAAPPVSGEQA